jgi:hypothetical protein
VTRALHGFPSAYENRQRFGKRCVSFITLGDGKKCGKPLLEINNFVVEDCTRKELEGIRKLKICSKYQMMLSSSDRNTIAYLKSSGLPFGPGAGHLQFSTPFV